MIKKDLLDKSLLVTHKDCPDGSGAAVVFRAAGGHRENIRFVSPMGVGEFFNKNFDVIKSYEQILIIDVAPDVATADRIEKEFGHVSVIDHHKTALHLVDRDWCKIDVTRCGTLLLFNELFVDVDTIHFDLMKQEHVKIASLKKFAILTNDRDMWLRGHKKSNEMSMLMDFLGQSRYIERAMEDLFFFDWKPHEVDLLDILMEKKESYVEEKADFATIVEKEGIRWGYTFIGAHESDVLNRIIEKHDVDVAVGIKLDRGTVSVRSKDTFDSSEFCKTHGGGGHKRAAGHSVDDETLKEIMEIIHP